MAPLAAVSGTRANLISPNVGGGKGSSDAFGTVDRVLCRTYWFVLNVEMNTGLIKYSRMPEVSSTRESRLGPGYLRTKECDTGDSAA
jgi:hypothetical protein